MLGRGHLGFFEAIGFVLLQLRKENSQMWTTCFSLDDSGFLLSLLLESLKMGENPEPFFHLEVCILFLLYVIKSLDLWLSPFPSFL